MSRLLSAIDRRTLKARSPRVWKIGGATVVALVTMWAACWFGQVSPVRAEGLAGQAEADKQAPLPADLAQFSAEVERRLRICHERIVGLAKPMLESLSEIQSLRDKQVNQKITVSSAKGNFGNATLTREVAEIAVVEYELGIFLQDKATDLGELKLAQTDLLRANDKIEGMKRRLAKIKEVSKGSAADVALEYDYEDAIAEAERREPISKHAVDLAELKLKMLEEYTKPKRVKELQHEVEKARADELAKKATWELETSKDNRIEAAMRKTGSNPSTTVSSESLERLFALDEKIRAELAQLVKTGKLDDRRRKGVLDLTEELEGVVDRVEAEIATAQVDRVKAAIHAGTGRARTDSPRAGANVQSTIPAEVSGFISDFTRRLKTDHERMVRLASPVLETINGQLPLELDPVSQETRVEAAKVSLKTAQLAREVAQSALKEHSEENGKQEESTILRELVQAQEDAKRALNARTKAIDRFEKIKRLANGSATDLQLKFRFEAGPFLAELGQQKAQFAIEQAKSKLKVLNEYTVPKRTRELKSEIERVRSDELAKKATLNLEQGKLSHLKRATKKQGLPAREQKLLASLEDAFSIDAAIRTKLEQVAKNGKIDPVLQKEIQDLANQLESNIDLAEAGRAAASFDELKNGMRRLPAGRSLFRSLKTE